MQLVKRPGDTLIEVVIALAILTSLLTVATAGSLNSWRVSRAAAERTQAQGLAQRQAEALKAYRKSRSWGHFSSHFTAGAPVHMELSGIGQWQPAGGSILSGPIPFTISLIPNTGLSQFDVKVEWQSQVRPSGSALDNVSFVTAVDGP